MKNKDIVFIEEDLESLIPNFLKNREKEISSLSIAVSQENYSQISFIAHGIKGVSGSYGFQNMCALANDIEFSAKDKNLNLVKNKLIELIRHFENIKIIFQ